jgi:2-polyprenyl-3-methyl-5-hydroxy-6-metoxy-1,4-benzoquinol methylase
MKMRLIFEFDRFTDSLNSNIAIQKTTAQSKEIYQGYDDREIRAYFSESGMMLMNNRPVQMSFLEERQIHLSYIFAEIDTLLKMKEKVSILEVGCGNCINIYEILAKYGDRVEIHGIDISDNRIANGIKYFGDDLSRATFHVGSITEKTVFESDRFDLVYSMFCLEQIAYDL